MQDYNSKKVYFSINKKSYLVAYILLFFLFPIGAHRFYTKNTTSAIVLLLSTILAVILLISGATFLVRNISPMIISVSGIGVFIFIILFIWFIIDILLTYKNVDIYNTNLAAKIGLLKKDDLVTK